MRRSIVQFSVTDKPIPGVTQSLDPCPSHQRDHAERVEWSLQWLADKAGSVNMITRVYEVEGLFCELYAHLGEAAVLTFYQTQEYLKTSVYDHEAGTR